MILFFTPNVSFNENINWSQLEPFEKNNGECFTEFSFQDQEQTQDDSKENHKDLLGCLDNQKQTSEQFDNKLISIILKNQNFNQISEKSEDKKPTDIIGKKQKQKVSVSIKNKTIKPSHQRNFLKEKRAKDSSGNKGRKRIGSFNGIIPNHSSDDKDNMRNKILNLYTVKFVNDHLESMGINKNVYPIIYKEKKNIKQKYVKELLNDIILYDLLNKEISDKFKNAKKSNITNKEILDELHKLLPMMDLKNKEILNFS